MLGRSWLSSIGSLPATRSQVYGRESDRTTLPSCPSGGASIRVSSRPAFPRARSRGLYRGSAFDQALRLWRTASASRPRLQSSAPVRRFLVDRGVHQIADPVEPLVVPQAGGGEIIGDAGERCAGGRVGPAVGAAEPAMAVGRG